MIDRRPKLLFLSGYFPPAKFSSGSVRTWNIARSLARLGWDVSVVTPHPSVWKPQFVENADQVTTSMAREGIRPIYTAHRRRFLAPSRLRTWDRGLGWLVGGLFRRLARLCAVDTWSGWVPEVEKACRSLESSDVDVILASGAPFVSFSLADRLSRRLNCPFVLDYRDLWIGDPHLLPANPADILLEQATVTRCAAAIAVSPSIAAVLERRYRIASKLHVLANGYDADEMSVIQPSHFGHFAFVYTGRLLPPLRTLAPFFGAMQRVAAVDSSLRGRWRLHYYGQDGKTLLEDADRYGLQGQVDIHGLVPRQEALGALKGAGLGLVVTSVASESTIEQRGVVTGKIFEAIGLRTPFLVVTPRQSDVEDIVETTGLGACFPAQDIAGMASFITSVMRGNTPPAKRPEAYAWQTLGQGLDEILRGSIPLGEMKVPRTVRTGGRASASRKK
jgi:glycosyltransferase involved in cell wall biosynthesis